jgi:flagellar basal-body rod protein FlgB
MRNDIFGLSAKALQLCEQRAVTLTKNVVNSSTPHYKAQDFDFQTALLSNDNASSLQLSNAKHLSGDGESAEANMQYRVPTQMTLDGNTVDEVVERKNFIENAMQYQVNLTMIQNQTSSLMKAIKGE